MPSTVSISADQVLSKRWDVLYRMAKEAGGKVEDFKKLLKGRRLTPGTQVVFERVGGKWAIPH